MGRVDPARHAARRWSIRCRAWLDAPFPRCARRIRRRIASSLPHREIVQGQGSSSSERREFPSQPDRKIFTKTAHRYLWGEVPHHTASFYGTSAASNPALRRFAARRSAVTRSK